MVTVLMVFSRAAAAKRERVPQLLALQRQGQRRDCSKLVELVKALRGTVVPVARERNFARAKRTERVEFPQQQELAPAPVKRKQAATELDLPAERSRPEPTELMTEQEPILLRLENPRMLVQARRAAKPLEQVEHWPATLLESTPARWKLRELLARAKNNLRPPR